MGVPDITLRDYFAAMAMQAMLSAYKRTVHDKDESDSTSTSEHYSIVRDDTKWIGQELAMDAYDVADQMIEAREESNG